MPVSECRLKPGWLAEDLQRASERVKQLRPRKSAHELVPFLAMWATQYQRDYKLDGLHPVHYDLMVKYGARMDDFKRATNAHPVETIT